MTSSRSALTFILLTVFIDSLGWGIIIPSMPPMIMELTGSAENIAAVWSGYLMAVYAMLQFFMAPVFGALSDRFGRRPMLLLSLLSFGLDFLLTGLATSMTWLFVGRAFAGVFGASFAPAGAYIGDVSDDSNRARNFGFIGAAFGFGFTLGPAIGTVVTHYFDVRAAFFVAAGLALANAIFGYFVLPESLPRERRRKFEWMRANPFGAVRSVSHFPMVASLLAALFLYQIAHDSLPSVWMFYVLHKFNWGPFYGGWSITFVGVMTVIVMGGLAGWLVPKFGDRRSIMSGFSIMAMGFVAYALVPYGWMIYPAIAFGALGGIANPAMQSVMSRQAGPSAQGELQGVNACIASVAAVISPLFMTHLFERFSAKDAPVYLPGAPFLVSAVLVFCCVLIAARAVRPPRP